MNSIKNKFSFCLIVFLSFVSFCFSGYSQFNYQVVPGDTSGYTPGSFSVSDGGAASYSVPVIISPGSSGMQPQVSFSYSSQGGNGLMGLGWSLQGLSAITLAEQTIAQDGKRKGITYSSEDRYALDGERLIVTDLGVTYGSNGAEYRTEQNVFSKVVSYGNTGGGIPESFKVWTGSGLIMEYGNSPDSRIEVGGSSPIFWLVNKVSDTKGNYYTVTYDENSLTGEYFPVSINYTGNASAGIVPYASVKFSYESRPDSIRKYLAGKIVSASSRRIKSISSFYGNTLVRAYQFTYQLSPAGLSQMVSFKECGIDGKCHSPSRFTWKNLSNYSYVPFDVNNLNLGANDDVAAIDFNSDGVQDLLRLKKPIGGQPFPISVFLSNKNQDNLTFNQVSVSPVINNDSIIKPCDFNGDGKTDILQYGKSNGASRLFLNSTILGTNSITFNSIASPIPTNLLKTPNVVITLDLNSDGRSDLISFNPENGTNYWMFSNMAGVGSSSFQLNGGQNYWQNLIPTSFFSNQNIRPLISDFNGDGLTDFLFWNKSSGSLTYFQNSGGNTIAFSNSPVSGVTASQITGGDNVDIFTHDINSDGTPDLFFWDKTNGTNRWWINKGDLSFISVTPQFSPSSLSFGPTTANADFLLPVDFNADGLNDYVAIFKNTGEARWLRNEGGMKFRWMNHTVNSNSPVLPWNLIQSYDFEGMGNYTSTSMLDMLFLNKNANPQIRVLRGINESNNLITQISAGSGQEIDIEYDFLTSDKIYEKRGDAVYPLMDYQATQFAVKSYRTDDGVGGKRYMDYKYVGAKIHLAGRGFRGYSEVHMTDRTTGVIQIKYFMNDTASYKYVRSPLLKSITRLPNGVAISVVNYQNEFKSFYGGRSSFSFVRKSVNYTYELPGEPTDTTTTYSEYDEYGNITLTETNYGSGFKDLLVNTFSNNPSTWIVGRLLQSRLYRFAPGGQTAIKASAFEYNSSGLLIKEIAEPDSAETVKIVKTYTHDSLGNILKSETSAWNGTAMQVRAIQTSYDPLGRFVLETKNDLNHTLTKTYDPLLGSELTVTDANGLITTNIYDGFGRKIKSVMPDGNWRTLDYRKCGASNSCPPLAYHLMVEQSSNSPKAIKYYDLYNREIRTETIGFDGTKVFQDNVYDNRSQLIRESNPYFVSETPVWTQHSFDISGRKVSIIRPGNRKDSIVYQGRTTVFINPKGQQKTIIKDAKDQLKVSRDHYGKEIRYDYDARGNLLKTTDPVGNEIRMSYDIYGNKASMKDPDMGQYRYVYNRFGEIVKQTDPSGLVSAMEYDILGRLIKRTESEGITTWTYDTRPYGKGMPATVSGQNGYQSLVDYDNKSRKIKDTQVINGATYVQQYTYDNLGRPGKIIYPTGFTVENDYNTSGYLYRLRNPADNKVYWQALNVSARQQLIRQRYGNGLEIARAFNSETDFLTKIQTFRGNNSLQHLGFEYDALGNLTRRKDVQNIRQEDFEYDALNRLLEARVAGNSDTLKMLYDELGNILYKSDVGTYHYGSVNNGPHRLESVDLNTTQCVPGLSINTSYYSFNKVKSVSRDSTRIDVFYNAGRQRNMQKMYVGNNLVRTKIYVSSLFEKEIRSNDSTQIHYISGPEGVIAVYTKKGSNQTALTYKHRDHIGSVVMISNDTGAIVAHYSYDAWGKRRNSDWSNSLTDTSKLANERGFTGHEHYDLFELIDMNGRIYDPVLARFLSPDPFIQDPTNLQSLNRYAYVVNNPLTLVDPSGHFFGFLALGKIGGFLSSLGGPFKLIGGVMMDIAAAAEHVANVSGQWLKENWKTIVVAAVAITVGVLTAGVGAGVLGVIISGAASGFASGVTATLLNGGNIGDALIAGAKGAAIGAITSAATFGVGSLAEAAGKSMGSAGYYGVKAIGHGVVQGASNVAQGGKFSHGFFSGAVSGAVAPWINNQLDSRIAKVAVSAIVGGTTSAICGGKFANGAVTGAFVMMYNDFMHERAAELKEKIENMTSEQTERLSTHDKLLVNAAHEYATQMENSHGFIQESVTELKFLGKKFLIDLLVPNQNHSIPSNIEDPSLKGDVYNIDKNINSIFQH